MNAQNTGPQAAGSLLPEPPVTATELLARYARDGVELWAEDGQLRYRAPRGYFSDQQREELRAHKDAVLTQLAGPTGRHLLGHTEKDRYEPFPLTDIQGAYLIGRTGAYAYGDIACHAYVELTYPTPEQPLDPAQVADAWNTLVTRHDMLRAVVHPDGYQRVLPEVPGIEVTVTEAPDTAALATQVARARDRHSHRAGPADTWPLFRLVLSRCPERAVLHLSFDMLAVDHASLRLLLTEFHHLMTDSATELPPPAVTFRDYVLARRALTETADYAADRAYWTDRLPDLPPAPELPLAEGWAAPADPQTQGEVRFERYERLVDATTARKLAGRAGTHSVPLSTVLLAAYAEVIGRWSRTTRFTLNVPTVSRLPLHPDIDTVVGDFTALELLAVDLGDPAVTFADRARALGGQLLDDLAHPLFTGSEVLAGLSRRAGTPVLMPVVFTSAVGRADTAAGVPAEVSYAATQTPQVWLDCQAMARGNGLALSWDVRTGVLAAGLAEDMFGAWTELVTQLAEDEGAWGRPAAIGLPAAQAERRARVNATGGPLPDGPLHEPVLAQALRTPDALAVRSPERDLTYHQLVARARALAERLTSGGLRPADPIAIWMDKGWEQIVAVLATLLAGGAYLPVDSAQPAARRDTILADAQVRTVLTQSWLAEADDIPADLSIVSVDELPEGSVPEAAAPPRRGPDDLAYVIYTSGSTGTPKGVMISHRAAANTIEDINRRHRVSAGDRVLGLAALGFDLSVYDIFGPLSVGGTLVLPAAERRGDPSHWAELVAAEGVTVWNSVPAQLQMLCDWLRAEPLPGGVPGPRLALVSGDWIPVALPGEARAVLPGLEIVSLGGATEGAIWSIAHPVGEVDTTRPSIPYGRPLTNQTFHVLDHAMRPRPDWAAGELYIGGAGVALGYLGDRARTAERFVTRPETGIRLYRTGDMGRYLPSGDIEFLGRDDAQVKIRGYRVELAEVEAAVQAHPAVAAGAVVVDDSASGGRRLAAFVETARRDPASGGDAAGIRRAAAVHDAAAAAIRAASASVDGDRLHAFLEALDEAALAAMARALDVAFGAGGTARTADEISIALRATPRHWHIVRRWLRALVAEGRLTRDPESNAYGGLRAATAGEQAAAWQRAAQLEREIGWSTQLLDVMRTCADRLPELVAGDADIRSLLFPGAALESADAAYRDNLAIRHLNHALAAALKEIAAAHTGEGRLRVLEVGGGVGGTTGELVAALAEFGVEYTFTDASPFFLAEARERLADHPWVGYRRFNVDHELREQGFLPNTYDVVVCANTLHAATDADAAVGRLRELLVPGGYLAFVENTRDDHYPLHVSMEFLEVAGREWTDLRAAAGQSFLTRPQWTKLLAAHGATEVTALPEPHDPLAAIGQELLLARVKTGRMQVPTGELARSAANRLPEYMVPSVWQVLDELPRTANGKTDRARLASWVPHETDRGADTADVDGHPLDELESRLADLWAQLLAVDSPGRNDDFFALGGDSLLVARMVGQLREHVPQAAGLEWEVVLRHMLRRPTVAGLAAFLRGVGGESDKPSAPADAGSQVVHLHGSGSPEAATTVLVHAGTGTIMPYRALITEIRRRSPGAANVAGLEVPGLDAFLSAPPEGLIERLAAGYARALMAGGCRSFHVVGYCLGGLIATEVARGLAESGARVESLTVISSHSPRFRLDDELLSEYSFAVMMGIGPADLGFPGDENRVAAAADAVLAQSPGILRDGGLAALTGEFADVGECFSALAGKPRGARIARMCEAVPAAAGTYAPDHMTRLFRAFRQSVFAITRYQAEPYADNITFLRHSGAYPFPGSKEAVTEYWEELTLGTLKILDIAGDHFSCLSVEHAPAVLRLLEALTDGAVTR